MTDNKPDELSAKEDALEAWRQLPQGVPSREALPPAGGGLSWFLGLFTAAAAPFREHKWLVVIAFIALILTLAAWLLS